MVLIGIFDEEDEESSHEPLCSGSEPKTVLKSELEQKLNVLLRLVQTIDRPQVSFSEIEILDFLTELGLFVQQCSQKTFLNPEVFEDPAQRSDEIGNVQMIHRTQSHQTTEFFSTLGAAILDLSHQAFAFYKREISTQELLASTRLGEVDDLQSEESAVAKWKIGLLRHQSKQAARKIALLENKVRSARKACSRFVELAYRSQWCPSCGRLIERVKEPTKHNHFTCEGMDKSHLNGTNVDDKIKLASNQIDHDGNFSTVSTWLNFD